MARSRAWRRSVLLLLAAATVFAGGLLAATRLALFGTVSVTRLDDGPACAVAGAGRVGVLVLPDRPSCPAADRAATLARCQERIEALGWRTKRVSPGQLAEDAAGSADPLQAVLVPRAPCLAADEAAALTRYANAGGRLVLQGEVGTRDAFGRESGWDLVAELIGVERVEALPAAASSFVAVPEASPLGAGIGGTRIAASGVHAALAVATGTNPYWSDARLQPRDATLPAGYQAAAVHAEHGTGRVVWIGFDGVPGVASPLDRSRYDRLLRNATAWAAGLPTASVDPWPGASDAAVLLQVNASAELDNLAPIADALAGSGVRGTFVLPTDVLQGARPVVAQLLRGGEIALARSDPGSRTDGRARAQLQADRLRARLSAGEWPSAAAVGATAIGPADARLLLGAGIDHVLASGEVDALLPSRLGVRYRCATFERSLELVRIARTTDDDMGLSPLGFAGLQADWVRRRLEADFASVASLGGLYVLGFHTQGLGTPESLPTLLALVRAWKTRAWIADAGEIAAWWRGRAGLQVALTALAADRYRLTLLNQSDSALRDVGVTLRGLPGASATGGGPAGCHLAAGPDGGRALFPAVPAGGEASCVLSRAR